MELVEEIRSYRQEWLDHGGRSNGDGGLQYSDDIGAWIDLCHLRENPETNPDPQWADAEQYLLMRTGTSRILGMLNFRHRLNDYLAEYAGHIGYGVRPSEWKKGYAKRMLSLCLERCREYGLDSVLITCDHTNEASRRTILSCGGMFERTTTNGDETLERYWIHL